MAPCCPTYPRGPIRGRPTPFQVYEEPVDSDSPAIGSSGACIVRLMYSPLVSSSSSDGGAMGLLGESPKLLVGVTRGA